MLWMKLKIIAKNEHLEIGNNLIQANFWFESKEASLSDTICSWTSASVEAQVQLLAW